MTERLRRKGRHRASQIFAPDVFNLSGESGKCVFNFLRAVSRTVLELRVPTRLNFRNTTTFHPSATILLFAELDRIATMSEHTKPLTIVDPIRRRPREVLKQIGIHEITGDTCNTVPSRADVVYWKSIKGKDQSGSPIAPLADVITAVNRGREIQIKLARIWRGITEVIANSVEHAYKHPRQDGFSGLDEIKWWMFTQLRDSTFTVAVCDLGCGYDSTIRHTIPEAFISGLRSIFGKNKNTFAIKVAMEYGRSETRENQRGKGSGDALSVIEAHKGGSLMIISNTGYVEYICKDGKAHQSADGELGIDIGGTITLWKLPLEAKR